MFLFDGEMSTNDNEKTSKNVSEVRPNFNLVEARPDSKVCESHRPTSLKNHSVESIVNGSNGGSRKRKMSEKLIEIENCSKKSAKMTECDPTNEEAAILSKR